MYLRRAWRRRWRISLVAVLVAAAALTIGLEQSAAQEGTPKSCTVDAQVVGASGQMSMAGGDFSSFQAVSVECGTPVELVARTDPSPLTLTLTSSRELCTANTLTELSWVIAGGQPPYTLTVAGETVDVAAESVRVNCGPLTLDPFTGDPLPNQTKAFNATVTDAQTPAASTQASVSVALAEALAGPTNVEYQSYVGVVLVTWDPVTGAGSQSPLGRHPQRGVPTRVNGSIRTRAVEATEWDYQTLEFDGQSSLVLETPPGPRALSLAAVRHALELETPEALNWSGALTYAAATEAENVVISASHDTITVSWDKQPYARWTEVQARLRLADANAVPPGLRMIRVWEEVGVSGRHQVVFSDLPAETDFLVWIVIVDTTGRSEPTLYAARTEAPPPDWTPLPLGAQNLRVTTSAEGYIIDWDSPNPNAFVETWFLNVENAATGEWVFGTGTHGATTWTILRDRLRPSTRYRVIVSHHDLKETETSIEFVTLATNADDRTATASVEGVSELNQLAFFPVWPVGLDGRYAMTDDPFQQRGSAAEPRYHAGLDIGEHSKYAAAEDQVDGDPVYAVADGLLSVYNYNLEQQQVEYCPDHTRSLHEQFHVAPHVPAGAHCRFVVAGSSCNDYTSVRP